MGTTARMPVQYHMYLAFEIELELRKVLIGLTGQRDFMGDTAHMSVPCHMAFHKNISFPVCAGSSFGQVILLAFMFHGFD